MSKKILFKQQSVENVLLEASQVMDITAQFLCSLLKHPTSHEQHNLVYSLSLSYNLMEQLINDSLKASFSVDVFQQKYPTSKDNIAAELKGKLKQFGQIINESRVE
ncbi:hypothetical protein [Aliikangiella sp. IMCC44359]|uniref:hypothetical protein n=1 Tax=Aliikangiella sp. IMCC44359 TaxID=3459125 RepID=UPI00403ACC54